MSGYIKKPHNKGWDVESETWEEFKERRSVQSGVKSISQPNSVKKQQGECKVTGIPKRKCECRTCINRRNRSKGRTKQNTVRKKLKIPSRKFHGADAHEENWDSSVRIEVKSGKQVGPIYTRFQKAEQQSWDNVKDAIGGVGKTKPFMMVAMPEGTSDGLCLIRLSELEKVMEAIQDNWERNEEIK
jgi:hypothetical protein